jgi:hypothetical protein
MKHEQLHAAVARASLAVRVRRATIPESWTPARSVQSPVLTPTVSVRRLSRRARGLTEQDHRRYVAQPLERVFFRLSFLALALVCTFGVARTSRETIPYRLMHDLPERFTFSRKAEKFLTAALPHSRGPAEPLRQPIKAKPDPETLRAKVLKIINLHSPHRATSSRLASVIVHESLSQGYDPLLVAAVVKAETRFRVEAESHAGALGPMQITPQTRVYIETLSGFAKEPKRDLRDVRYNVRLGIRYLRHLERMWKGDRVLALASYNWGPGHVKRVGAARALPGSVSKYARAVLHDHSRWRQG